MSIKIKLILAVVGVLAIVGTVMGMVVFWQNDKNLTTHFNSDIKNNISYTFQLADLYLSGAENSLSNLATDPLVVRALETKDPALLAQVSQKLTNINDTVDVIENIDLHQIVGPSCILLSGDKESLPFVGTDFSGRDYCQGLLKTKQIYLSSAFISTVSKKPVLAVAIPIKNSKDELIGDIVGLVDLTELRAYLWDLQKNSVVDMIDHNGVQFLNTQKIITDLNQSGGKEEGEIIEVKKRLANGQIEGYFKVNNSFVGYKSNGRLTIIYEKLDAELSAFSDTVNFTILLSLIVAILLTILIIYLFVSQITKRISRLSHITQEIAAGKFNNRIGESETAVGDEVGVLAKSFNEMVGKITAAYKSLENKVKERTAEVEEKNKKLEAAAGELKKTVDLLNKTNKAMVGRELKMVELKKKMSAMEKEAQLGKSKETGM
ncbi:MAG: HAMP domain-containing protein [Candidatus Falkowbacteria bacterium]